MHRHSYQGRKLSLKTDQRNALLRGLVTSLVLHEQIETTLPKAKEVAPAMDRLVTKAKLGTLAGQRSLRQYLLSEAAVQKMIQELAEAFSKRDGGYTRIIKTGNRRGDNAPKAVISLVLPVKTATKVEEPTEDAKPVKKAPVAKKPVTKAIASAKPAKKSRIAKGAARELPHRRISK